MQIPAVFPTEFDIEKVHREPYPSTSVETAKAHDEPQQARVNSSACVHQLSGEDYLVTFKPGDEEDPQNWSRKKKYGVTLALSATAFNRIMISTIMAPGITTISEELNMTTTESTMALSVYILATAFGPLILGPLSEVYGRKPLVHGINIWLLVWNLICGFAHSKGLLIAARLIAGLGGSAVFTLGYGVLSDIWHADERGRTMSLYLLIPLTGTAVGPIIGGFIIQYTTWRWMFWATTISHIIIELCSITIIRETYAPLLLLKRASKLRQQTGNPRYHTKFSAYTANRSALWTLRQSLTRPLRLLAFHPIIQIQALCSGLSYGLLYFALSSYSTLYTTVYHEPVAISGLHYIAICAGEVLGAQLCGPSMDYLYRVLKQKAGGEARPEHRVPMLLPSLLITPVGLLLYGWATQRRLYWLVVDVGVALLCLGMQVFGMIVQAYIMDSYPDHVSSASAASQLLKGLLAFAFPLFADRLYRTLGYGWGNSLLALVSLGITLPSAFVLWRYGARLRGKMLTSY
ncbi:MFS transporter-like protein 14 [Elsinoe australis]|uniref:MFS transporter-like protein 14 n=1 Tax=Elsinoe australis TaxID=40998 RepID=A0A4U7BD19_9PEZI|nr:MFS transporter-like protein 14 [Elsinoe australis]